MDSRNQFSVFCLCLLIGFINGVVYEPFAFVRILFKCRKEKNKTIGRIADILFFLIFSILCIYASYRLHFPDFRWYMSVGYGLGFIIYLKILHRIVAIFEKVCYNIYTQGVKKAKKQEKLSKKEVKINI